MRRTVLPEKYYLAHFEELICFVEVSSSHLLEPTHRQFLEDFRSLSEDAQCVFVRMMNRKAHVFPKSEFQKYQEIRRPEQAVDELLQANFVRRLKDDDLESFLQFLTKPQLVRVLDRLSFSFKRSAGKQELEGLALANRDRLCITEFPDSSEMICAARTDELSYLVFLYFGKIQVGINLQTLRDLGIRRTNQKERFQARFRDLEEAKSEYFYESLLRRPPALENLEDWNRLRDLLKDSPPRNSQTQKKKDALLWDLAESVKLKEPSLSESILSESMSPPARERRVRLLWQLGRSELVKELLQEILSDPLSDEELLFAEDFSARKFEGKRRGTLTETLSLAPELTLSDLYFRKPERGVRDHFRGLGQETHFTENHLWNGLFGLLFWEELFESEQSAIFNPFERSPQDLIGPEFYERHQEAIESKLALFANPAALQTQLLKTVSRAYGQLNDIFQWHPNLLPQVLSFLKMTKGKDLGLVLRTMAQRYDRFHSGFPDLMVEEKGEWKFVEVKAEGDSLRPKQFSKIKLLRQAGFSVDVMKVKWQADPEQTYVVVDIETTGGTANFHRITEIGAVKIRGGQVVDEFQTLLNPGRPIPAFITKLTGITDEMVRTAPTFAEVAEAFQEFMGRGIFVAHNVRFDYGFLQREYQRLDQQFRAPQMCTCLEMRRKFPGLRSYGLKNLTEHFGVTLDQHHRALADARAAAELLRILQGHRPAIDRFPDLPEAQNSSVKF